MVWRVTHYYPNYSVTQRTDAVVGTEATTVATSIAVPVALILVAVVIVIIVLVVVSRRRAKRKKMSVYYCTLLISLHQCYASVACLAECT